jgi:pimeloyl-ACP methyl ester carboxylesterase
VRRGAKIAIGLVVALVALLIVNTLIVDGETKEAETTIDGGEILELPGGQVQVFEEGSGTGAPIVLLHCYTCSLHWWDSVAPILSTDRRVIRIDLLGHGGSQKPSSGYDIDEQSALVAGALDRLGVQGAVVVGHSLGFPVAVAVAERATQLVDRLVNLDSGPASDSCELPFLARLAYTPVLGQAIWRLTPSFAIRSEAGNSFAPNYELSDELGDQIVDDFRAMTYTSYEQTYEAYHDYLDEATLDDRLRPIPVPLLSIFGAEDQLCDVEAAQEAYAALPGARTETLAEVGHSPNVERPEETAVLIERFAAEAAVAPDEAPSGGGGGGSGGGAGGGGERPGGGGGSGGGAGGGGERPSGGGGAGERQGS